MLEELESLDVGRAHDLHAIRRPLVERLPGDRAELLQMRRQIERAVENRRVGHLRQTPAGHQRGAGDRVECPPVLAVEARLSLADTGDVHADQLPVRTCREDLDGAGDVLGRHRQ